VTRQAPAGRIRAGAAATGLAALALARPAIADPFVGTGQAPAADGAAGGHREALARARTAALVDAVDATGAAPDAPGRAAVLAQGEAWTGAYRILQETHDGATVTVRVEVDIDVARLRKRIAGPGASATASGWVWSLVGSGACPSAPAAVVERALGRSEAAGTGRRALALEMECHALGPVPFTHVHGARVELVARTGGADRARASGIGFGSEPVAAIEVAVEDVSTRLARALGAGPDAVELRLEHPWPAGRVRHVEAALREAVLGVDSVALVGIDPDGTVRLEVRGNTDAAALAAALRSVSLPGFALSGFRVDSPHVVTVRIAE
jgi:hypothetical protein